MLKSNQLEQQNNNGKVVRPTWRGFLQGMKIGLLVSAGYALLLSLGVVSQSGPLALIFLVIPASFAVILSILIGALTGWLIGSAFEQTSKILSQNHSYIIGGMVSVTMVFLANLPLWVWHFDYGLYIFIIGIPSLIYIVVSVWMSGQLYHEVSPLIPLNRLAIIPPFVLTVIVFSGWYLFWYQHRVEIEHFVIQKGYIGLVAVAFDQKEGRPLKYDWFTRVYEIPSNGVLFVKSQTPGWQPRFWYSDATGQREELAYFYWCDDTKKLQDTIVVCGNLSGFLNNYDHPIKYRAYIVAPANQTQKIEEEFNQRNWYEGDDVNNLFPEK